MQEQWRMTPRFLVQTSGRKMQSHSEMPKTGRVICLFLATQHVRSSSPTWDQIHAPCIGSMAPQLLDCLGHFIRFWNRAIMHKYPQSMGYKKEKGATEDEMVWWHHRLNGHESEQALGVGDRQRQHWCAAVHGVAKSWTRLSNWTTNLWKESLQDKRVQSEESTNFIFFSTLFEANLHYNTINVKFCMLSSSFPGGSEGKESACNAGDLGWIPGLGRSPGEGNGSPLQCSCLENPHGQRSLAGYSP